MSRLGPSPGLLAQPLSLTAHTPPTRSLAERSFKRKMNGTCFETPGLMDPPAIKVWLYPEEGWARASCNSHWLIKTPWWSRRHCYILEVEGTKRHKTVGRVLPAREGEVVVEGTFRGLSEGDFRLVLTTTVTLADLQRGYHMTGSLERGDRKLGQWQTTHLAVTKRSGFS